MSTTPTTTTTATTTPSTTAATAVGANISMSLLMASILGVIAMFCVIGLFAAKPMLGIYFSILYYIVYPVVIYLIAVGFNAISQRGACNGVTNITSCFTGAAYTVGYLYATMVAVNLIGPNGIMTFESEALPVKNTIEKPANIPEKSANIPEKPANIPEKPANTIEKPANSLNEDPTPQGGGKRILRQRGGASPPMSDAALMIRSFFTTLRAPAMSLFIRDPNAATLEDVETKSPVYTGIGVGFWACLATISGQIISSSIAQVC